MTKRCFLPEMSYLHLDLSLKTLNNNNINNNNNNNNSGLLIAFLKLPNW